MCLIAFIPKIEETQINYDILERGFELNSDGAGYSFIKNGKVVIHKKYNTFSKFKKSFKRSTQGITGPVLIHFRKATCGSKNKTNTQPINIVKNDFVMAHNGVFSSLSFDYSRVSDSVRLAKLITQLGWSLPLNKGQVGMLKALCEESSKLVFMDKSGNYKIINEKLGKWKKGIWYSNTYAFTFTTAFSTAMYRDFKALSKENRYEDEDISFTPVSSPFYGQTSAQAYKPGTFFDPWNRKNVSF